MKVKNLKPASYNPRIISAGRLAMLKKSMDEFGDLSGVIFNIKTGNLVGGHQRLKHLDPEWTIIKEKHIDETGTVSVGYIETPRGRLTYREVSWPLEKEMQANIAANQHGGDFDDDSLARMFGKLGNSQDAALIGFDQSEFNKLFRKSKIEHEFDLIENIIPEIPQVPITKPGDVWQLGRHRIICGDCSDATVVQKLLNGVKPHLMVTDPPYGVEYDAAWRIKSGLNRTGAIGKVLNDNKIDWREAYKLFPGTVAYVWHADIFSSEVMASLEACAFKTRALIIWAKSQLVIGRGHYHHMHEPCWYVVKKGAAAQWNGGRKQTTLWRDIDDILRPDEKIFVRRIDAMTIYAISGDETTIWDIPKPVKSETGHSTQKPVECMRRPIENNSKPGDDIYEPFSGSGTTIIAAERTGRNCYAVELNPAYVDVAVKRWEIFTGHKGMLEKTE